MSWWTYYVHLKRMDILCMVWYMVHGSVYKYHCCSFRYSLSLLMFYLVILSVFEVEHWNLWLIVSTFPFNFVSFHVVYFEGSVTRCIHISDCLIFLIDWILYYYEMSLFIFYNTIICNYPVGLTKLLESVNFYLSPDMGSF